MSSDRRGPLLDRLRALLGPEPDAVAGRPRVIAAIREFIDGERDRLHAAFESEPSGGSHCQAQAAIFDVVLGEVFALASRTVEQSFGRFPPEADLCLAAVGGYGRASLSPWSDIDIVFIPANEQECIDAVVRETLLLLGDALVPGRHPQIAHSYRPLNDIGLIDHQTATALLESRHLAGDGSLHVHFMQSLLAAIEPVEFLHVNLEERQVVWEDGRQSVFAVEPNLKAGPGGLRDFHAAIWVAKVVYGINDWDILGVLRQRGKVAWDECTAVLRALEFVYVCRNWLHYARGQKLDVLHVPYQDDLGRALGYRPTTESAGEQVMRELYGCTRQIHDFSRRLLYTARRERIEFRHGTHVANWTLFPNHDGIIREDPARLVLLYEERQRLQLHMSAELDRLVTSSVRALDEVTRRKLAVGSSFLRILSSPRDVAGTLRNMLWSGVLEQVLPEFEPMMAFLPGDPAHEYTVGEHSLKAVEELQRLRDRPQGEDEHVVSDAIKLLREPEVLFLATLFHDVGKLDKSNEHSRTGAVVGEAVAKRLGMQEGGVARVRWLIERHLTMMRTARLGALPLPETIDGFVKLLPPEDPLDELDMLVALTWADADSVGDNVFRENERRLLMDLFTKAAKWIHERPMVDEPGARERLSRRLRDAPALRDVDPEVVKRDLLGLPTWYAVNTPPALIAKHISYLQRVAAGENPVVEFYHALQAMHTELTVCTVARSGLLRDIAAAVTANNLDIYLVQSDICCVTDGALPSRAVATIWVDDFGQPLGQVKKDRLRHDLESVLSDREAADTVLERRGKVVPERVVIHGITCSNTNSSQHTVVQVRADDQKGLLYRLTNALAAEGLDIMVAKVTTWRGAAEDAFYVVSQETGGKVSDAEADRLAGRLTSRLSGEIAGRAAR